MKDCTKTENYCNCFVCILYTYVYAVSMENLVRVASLSSITRFESLRDSARECFDRAEPETTRKAYQADWRRFSSFCEGLGVSPTTRDTQVRGGACCALCRFDGRKADGDRHDPSKGCGRWQMLPRCRSDLTDAARNREASHQRRCEALQAEKGLQAPPSSWPSPW